MITEIEYLNKIENAIVTQQQESAFNAFKKEYKNNNLNIMSYSFERFYEEYCHKNNYFSDVASYQIEDFR